MTYRLADVVSSWGVNVHLTQSSSSYADAGKVVSDLRYIGLQNVRQHIPTSAISQAGIEQVATAGLKFDFVTNGDPISTTVSYLEGFQRTHGSIMAIEGLNEVNEHPVAYQGLTGDAAGQKYQHDLFVAVNSSALLKNAAVYNFTTWPLQNGDADYGNAHSYSGAAQPYSRLSNRFDDVGNANSVLTETGAYTMPAGPGTVGVDEAAQARIDLNSLLDAYTIGFKNTFLYELIDGAPDPGNTDKEDHFGLFHADGTPKQVAVALHNFSTILSDTGTDAHSFTTSDLRYTFAGMPSTGHSMLLQKSSGVFDLVVWGEASVWSTTTGKAVHSAASTVTVGLDGAHSWVKEYDPLVGTSAIQSLTNASQIQIAVSDHPVVIEVGPLVSATSGGTSGTPGILLSGTNGDDALTGAGGADTIQGGAGNDKLDGGIGADRMEGGAGNDTYMVDNSRDTVIEAVNAGTDKVMASVSYTISDNIEQLVMTGASAVTGTGNALGNLITGNAAGDTLNGMDGNDTLNGGAGDDVLNGGGGNDTLNGGGGTNRLVGGAGDDLYYVNNSADITTEVSSGGTDKVMAGVSYTIGDNIEKLVMTGTSSLTGSGNDLDNSITANNAGDVLNGMGGADVLSGGAGHDTLNGGAGNDWIDGGASSDRMDGGLGDDTFIVDTTGDLVTEGANGGIDKVRASVNFTLGANIEQLVLTGSSALTGTGNALANVLIANNAGNTLYGMDGDDKLTGGAGDDIIFGGNGTDVLSGGGGSDILHGSGLDNMTGGDGPDRFVLDSIDLGGVAKNTLVINDFDRSVGDRVDLSNVLQASTGKGVSFHFVGSVPFSHQAGEIMAVVSNGNTSLYGDVNGDGTADFMIKLPHATITSSDFLF